MARCRVEAAECTEAAAATAAREAPVQRWWGRDPVAPLGRGDWRRARSMSAPLHGAGGWLATVMVADVATTKLATKVADCSVCRDAGPRQEPRRHEGGASPVNCTPCP
uniref:Uncharacterized protein n=1 Tax=Oryza barthii TaxID=65489 RepID=A0A0D3HP75_9ORYZ